MSVTPQDSGRVTLLKHRRRPRSLRQQLRQKQFGRVWGQAGHRVGLQIRMDDAR